MINVYDKDIFKINGNLFKVTHQENRTSSLLSLNSFPAHCSSVFLVNFEQVFAICVDQKYFHCIETRVEMTAVSIQARDKNNPKINLKVNYEKGKKGSYFHAFTKGQLLLS